MSKDRRKEVRDIDHPLYRVWSDMRNRCNNLNHPSYALYGGAGVRVDSRWDDFWVFVKDVSPKKSPLHSIDRHPQRHGNYSPDNWRWATDKEQAENRDSTTFVTVDGLTDTLGATADRIGMAAGCLKLWITRGLSSQESVERWRSKPKIPPVTVDGMTDLLATTAKRVGMSYESLKRWMGRGYSAQEVVNAWRNAPEGVKSIFSKKGYKHKQRKKQQSNEHLL